jgi:hypothetical protein
MQQSDRRSAGIKQDHIHSVEGARTQQSDQHYCRGIKRNHVRSVGAATTQRSDQHSGDIKKITYALQEGRTQ